MNKKEDYLEMDDVKTKAIHKAKAKSSFKTKMNLFLYELARNGNKIIDEKAFFEFKLEEQEGLIKEYTSEYIQEEYEHVIAKFTVDEIYERIVKLKKQALIKDIEKNYIDNFEHVFSYEDFKENLSKKECFYCDITPDDITDLIDKRQINKKANRGFNLEVERFDSNLEYTKDNCDMACYWCNNAKTDEFTKDEFKIIAKGIRKVWKERKLI